MDVVFYRVYTVLATLESSHWICLLLIRPESLQVCYVVNVLYNENDFFSIMKMILAHSFKDQIVNMGIIHFTRWA